MSGSRCAQKKFVLFPAQTVLGWRVLRMVRFEQGESKVARGEWRRVLDSVSGLHIGYQLCAPDMSRGDYQIPSQPSFATITARETEVNAFTIFSDGKSKTVRLSEDNRLLRKVPEDHVERTQAKIFVWPMVGAAKGDVLRAWPK